MAISRAPLADIEAFKRRMGWRFPWASSFGSDFNHDFGVSFTDEEIASGRVIYNFERSPFPLEEGPGLSVFLKTDSGDVFHTYSTYARGGEAVIGAYHYLDFVPKGRDEDGLAFTMSWVRHHDRYGADYAVDPKRSYEPPAKKDACCASHAQTEAVGGVA